MLAEDLARADRVEASRILYRQEFPPFAAIQRGAVGRDGDDHILLAEFQTLCDLDRGDKIGDSGKSNQLQPREQLRVNMTAVRQIGHHGLAVEAEVERPGASVR